MNLKSIRVILVKELLDSFRSIWVYSFVCLYFVMGVGVPLILLLAFHIFGAENVPGQLLLTAVELVPIVPLMPLIISSQNVVSEREKGTIVLLLSQPISRIDILTGKLIALNMVSSSVILAGLGLDGFVGFLSSPEEFDLSQLIIVILAMLDLSTISASLGVLLSILCKSRVVAVALALFIWFFQGIVFQLALLEYILLTLGGESPLLPLLTLLNPIEISRILAVLFIEPSINRLGPSGAVLLHFYGFSNSQTILVAASIAWMLTPVIASLLIFAKQED